jgi:hypothetical protein
MKVTTRFDGATGLAGALLLELDCERWKHLRARLYKDTCVTISGQAFQDPW